MKSIKNKLAVATTDATPIGSTVKKLSIATAGAAFVALGTVGMAPANASALTQLNYSGTANISIFGQSVSLPVNTSSTIDNLSGRLSDAGDSELTIDHPLSYLGNDFNDLLNLYSASINSLTGAGSVSNSNGVLSAFNFSYDNANDVFTVSDYDFDNLQVCLSSTCNIQGEGAYTGRINRFIPTSGTISFNVDQTATLLSDSPVVTQPSVTILASNLPVVAQPPATILASDLPVVTEPSAATSASASQSVPESSILLGLVGFGGFLAAKRKQRKAA
jgi:hypothetical protein